MRTALLLSAFLSACLAACIEPDDPTLGSESAASGIDADGDGYDSSADCDDADADVHPHTREVENGVDDNCAAGVDEPMLSYGLTRPSEAATYAQVPKLSLRITDTASISYLRSHASVKFSLTFQRLSDGSTPDYVTPLETLSLAPFGTFLGQTPIGGGTTTWTLRLDPNNPLRGLVARQIYRMQVQLFDNGGAALGPPTDWMYLPTAGTSSSPNTALQWWRIDLALRALDQYGDSEDGLIGKDGTLAPDGQRFTASNLTPLHPSYHPGDDLGWCDWFVHWNGAVISDGVDGNYAANVVVDGGTRFWHDMNPNMVPNSFRDPAGDGCGTELVDLDGNGVVGDVVQNGCHNHTATEVALDTDDNEFYSNIPGNIYYDAIKSLPQNQGIGNYEAIDNHAGIFLAFDPNGDGTFDGAGTIGTVWSIEGNVSDHVKVMHRTTDNPVINGYGKLDITMFQ